jgi:hypothetical protein
MNNRAIKVIGKYAILLIILYGVDTLVKYIAGQYINDLNNLSTKSYVLAAEAIFPYLLNVIAAFIVYSDKKKLEIEGKFSVLLTIFYRPIGIVLFLIYVIEKEIKGQHTTMAINNAGETDK